jgi:hypothetical protein
MADVFVNPDGVFDRLVVLSDTGLSATNPDSSLLASATPEQLALLIPPNQVQIPWASIVKVRSNRHRDDINVTFRGSSREELKNIGFKDAASRDAALRAIQKRLGPQFRWREEQYGIGRAAGIPLVAGVVMSVFTYVSAMAAAGLANGEQADIHGRNRATKAAFVWALDLIGPTGVWVVGGLAVACCVLWMMGRIKRPPLMVTIAR